MIFVLLHAMLNGLLFLGGSSAFPRLEDLRGRIRENVTDHFRKADADAACDEAEKVIVGVRESQAALADELQRILARPDGRPEALTAALARVDAEEEAAFRKLVLARRRLRIAVTPPEWRAIFPPTSSGR